MSELPEFAFVTPHGRALVEERGWTTRPARLALALAKRGNPVNVVARTPPWKTVRALRRVKWRPSYPVLLEASQRGPFEPTLLEHPFPAGLMESVAVGWMLARKGPAATVILVSDPRSAGVLRHRSRRQVAVFDAYDAWDLSPLFAGHARLVREIERGYRTAARDADLVVANTPMMADRMVRLGARDVELLPNGAPAGIEASVEKRPDVLYLGNVQRRVRLELLHAAADAAGAVGGTLRIVGQMQDQPDGWNTLISRQAVVYVGHRVGHALEDELSSAAIGIVPHRVDDYTRSQDAMKAWDYLAAGLPIVSTSVPPATSVTGLAAIADDPESFSALISKLLRSRSSVNVLDRRALATAHSWDQRASRLCELVDAVIAERRTASDGDDLPSRAGQSPVIKDVASIEDDGAGRRPGKVGPR